MTQVSQVQLVQPVLSICWAAVLLGEHLTWTTVLGGLVVILCAGAAVRVRLGTSATTGPTKSDGPAPHGEPSGGRTLRETRS